jgi:hypothetical protein
MVEILAACAWPEKEVYEALTHHYGQVVGLEIPRLGAQERRMHHCIRCTSRDWQLGPSLYFHQR